MTEFSFLVELTLLYLLFNLVIQARHEAFQS